MIRGERNEKIFTAVFTALCAAINTEYTLHNMYK